MHSLLLLKKKIQFCILCTVSVYTLAYTLQRVFFMARKEFFKVSFKNTTKICSAVLGHSKLQAFSLSRKKPNATVKETNTRRKISQWLETKSSIGTRDVMFRAHGFLQEGLEKQP